MYKVGPNFTVLSNNELWLCTLAIWNFERHSKYLYRKIKQVTQDLQLGQAHYETEVNDNSVRLRLQNSLSLYPFCKLHPQTPVSKKKKKKKKKHKFFLLFFPPQGRESGPLTTISNSIWFASFWICRQHLLFGDEWAIFFWDREGRKTSSTSLVNKK